MLTLTRSQEMQIKAIIIMFTLHIGNIRKFDNTHFRVECRTMGAALSCWPRGSQYSHLTTNIGNAQTLRPTIDCTLPYLPSRNMCFRRQKQGGSL